MINVNELTDVREIRGTELDNLIETLQQRDDLTNMQSIILLTANMKDDENDKALLVELLVEDIKDMCITSL